MKHDGRQHGDGRRRAAHQRQPASGVRIQQRLRPAAATAHAKGAPQHLGTNHGPVSIACAGHQTRHAREQEPRGAVPALLSAIASHCGINFTACSIRTARCSSVSQCLTTFLLWWTRHMGALPTVDRVVYYVCEQHPTSPRAWSHTQADMQSCVTPH